MWLKGVAYKYFVSALSFCSITAISTGVVVAGMERQRSSETPFFSTLKQQT